jgi:uncharacterized protein DUF5924/DUF2914 family protein
MPLTDSRHGASSSPDPFVRQHTVAVTDWAAWRSFLTRWAVSLASLIAGLVALLVFRRGVPHVGWIVGYVVVLWLLFAVLTQTRQRLVAGGRRLVLVAGDYTIQTLYHGLLVFVLPGYFASATFDAATGAFFLVLAGAALLTTIDPWYRVLVHPYPWVGRGLFAFAIFAGLNVALPLVGVPPAWGLLGSAVLAGLSLTPAFVELAGSWVRAAGWGVVAAVAGAGLLWLGLAAVPPAPLQLVRPTLARGVDTLAPVEPIGARVPAATLAAWGGLAAYTPVVAPAGLRQPIVHEWRHDGRVVSTVHLPTPVLGGRTEGFRTFSRKADFPPDPRGQWSVDVRTASGQLIGRLRFTVVP